LRKNDSPLNPPVNGGKPTRPAGCGGLDWEMIEQTRNRINETLTGANKGQAKRLAAEAGISASTLSRFRAGTYAGRSDLVAARLAEALDSRDAATAIMEGRLKLAWLVSGPSGVRLVRTAKTLEKVTAGQPEAVIVQVWRGQSPDEIYFVRSGK
jgi:transcriptional regulator with XRE-family HTH domain